MAPTFTAGWILMSLCCVMASQYQAGIVLRSRGEVIIGGDYWTAALDIKIPDFENLVNMSKSVLTDIKSNARFNVEVLQQHISALENLVSRISKKAALLRSLLVTGDSIDVRRSKRGIVDTLLSGITGKDIVGWIGQGAKFLFGFFGGNKKKDIERLNKALDQLASRQQAFEQTTLTALKDLEGQIQQTSRALEDLSVWTKTQLTNLREEVNSRFALGEKLDAIGSVLEEFHGTVEDLLRGLEDTAEGRLSPYLMSPKALLDVLRNARRKFPESISPLTGLEEDEVYAYYTYASVVAIATTTSIRVFAKLPFKAERSTFDLYEPHPLPVLHKASDLFLEMMVTSDLLLVSKLKDRSALMSLGELRECKRRGDMHLCPADFAVQEGSSCVLSLVQGREERVKEMCERRVVPQGFPSRWVRDQNGWVYSVSKNTEIIRVSEEYRHILRTFVNGTGFLEDELNTYIKSGDGYVLQPVNNLGDYILNASGSSHGLLVPSIDINSMLDYEDVIALHRGSLSYTSNVVSKLQMGSDETQVKSSSSTPIIAILIAILCVAVVANFVLVGVLWRRLRCWIRLNSMNNGLSYKKPEEEATFGTRIGTE